MRMPLDEFIVTDANREAFERVKGSTQKHDEPERLFIVGPEDSGKTLLMRARAMEKDLLSTKSVIYVSAKELLDALNSPNPEAVLDQVGECDVLLIDDFPDLFSDPNVGPTLCKLLMVERAKHQGDTVFTSRFPLSKFDLKDFAGVMDVFEEIEIGALDEAGRRAFAESLRSADRPEDAPEPPAIGDDALDYIAGEYASKASEVRAAMMHLMGDAGFEPGAAVDAAAAKEALAAR